MSDSVPTRQIVVDDTDRRIVYSGPSWTLDTGDLDNIGFYGPIYNHTSHGTKVSSSLSFTFDGTSVSVFGTIQPVESPTWECFIDNVSIGTGSPSPSAQNNWILCEGNVSTAGPHTLSIRIAPSTNTFWFDYLRYTPLPDASFSEAVLYVPSNDPGITYSSNWEPRSGFANVGGASLALQPGATVKFDFVGTNVAWYGWLLRFEPLTRTNGTFTIDDGKPSTFTFGNTPPINTTNPNALFFTTPQLPAAQHEFVATYQGVQDSQGTQPTPLSLNYFLVTITSTPYAPSDPPSSTTSSSQTLLSFSSSQTSSSTSPPSPSSASKPRSPSVGVIVGSVLGGLALVTIVLGFCLWRMRRRYRREQPDLRPAQPFPTQMIQTPTFEGVTAMTKGTGTSVRNGFFSEVSSSSFEPMVARIESYHKPPLS